MLKNKIKSELARENIKYRGTVTNTYFCSKFRYLHFAFPLHVIGFNVTENGDNLVARDGNSSVTYTPKTQVFGYRRLPSTSFAV